MEAYLEKQGIWDIVSGESPKPTASPSTKTFIAWDKKRRLARSELILYISEKYVGICQLQDPKQIWETLEQRFRSRGQGAMAAQRRAFNGMTYDHDKSMKEWITEVETKARHLETIGSPMHVLDIYNTLIRNLPESYQPLIVQFDGLPTDPEDPRCITIEHVAERLINEEARQSTYYDEALYTSTRPSSPRATQKYVRGCYNCGEEGHVKANCNVSPRELRERKERKSPQGNHSARASRDSDQHAKVAHGCHHCSPDNASSFGDDVVNIASSSNPNATDIFLF